MTHDYIDTALLLASDRAGQTPSNSDLRRSVSTSYYALFHHLASTCANCLIGPDEPGLRRAWRQVYRSIDHRQAKIACMSADRPTNEFPQGIKDFCKAFVAAQDARELADYDPLHEIDGVFAVDQVLAAVGAMRRFDASDARHLKAFVIFVLFRQRA